MSFTFAALIASTVAWIFPAIRQFKTKLFYYFLLLALADPLAILLQILFKLDGLHISSILAGILLYYSIDFNWENILNHWIVNLAIVTAFIIGFVMLSNIIGLTVVCHFLIFSKFAKYIIIRLHSAGEVNSFYLVLIFYELTILVNLIAVIGGTSIAITLHYITLLFELLIAVFFSIFRMDNKALIIKLKPAT